MPVRWNADGFPYMTEGDETVPLISKVKGAKRGSDVTFGNFSYRDDFKADKLSLDWFSLRGPVDHLSSLTANPGYLTMQCADVKSSEKKVPAFLARRISHHKFECETSLKFNPVKVNEKAGLVLFKDETHQYMLCVAMTAAGKQVQVVRVGKDGKEEALASKLLGKADGDIRLKIVSRGLYFDFYYAKAGGKWLPLIADVDAGYLSTKNAGGFTGTVIALYASSK